MKIVLVKWMDTTTYSERHLMGDTPRYARLTSCETTGFLVEKTKEKVVVAHQIFNVPENEPLASDFTAIPRGCIKSIKELE